MKLALIPVLALLVGCSSLPKPNVGVYQIELHVLATRAEVQAKCRIGKIRSCAWPSGLLMGDKTVIAISVDDYRLDIAHEGLHATNKYFHD